MERDQKKKRSRAVDGEGDRKKERERKGKDIESDPAVVVAEDEVEEFFAILQRMQQAVKYYDKGKAAAKLPDPLPEVDNDDGVKKTTEIALLDLNSLPDDEE